MLHLFKSLTGIANDSHAVQFDLHALQPKVLDRGSHLQIMYLSRVILRNERANFSDFVDKIQILHYGKLIEMNFALNFAQNFTHF